MKTANMKKIVSFIVFFLLLSCGNQEENNSKENKLENPEQEQTTQQQNPDSLFQLQIKQNENQVKLTAPKNSRFQLPDSAAVLEPYKVGDFNADSREDVLVNFGACGTGGCLYGLFLKQFNNYYKLVFMDYLKNAEFKLEKSGFWTIESSEALEAYHPDKIQITRFKFNKDKYQYVLDSSYVYSDR